MFQVPQNVVRVFELSLQEAAVHPPDRPAYRKWVRFYLDFCRKYQHPP